MGTQTALSDPSLRPIDPQLRIGSVRLGVGDVARSVDFYERVLGLERISGDEHGAVLGPDRARAALALERVKGAMPAPPHSTGLFHVAWLHASRAALAATVERVIAARWPIHGASDHGVSEALYLTDPDGLGVEIYADRPREQWRHRAGDGALEMVTLALDVDDLLAQAPVDLEPSVHPATTVGHVHLNVADVARAAAFYRDALGFAEQASMPSAAFLSAGGYHHHIAVNSWQSLGASPAADSSPGLRLIAFELGSPAALAALEQRLSDTGRGGIADGPEPGRLGVTDPDGNRLMFSAAPG